MKGRNGSIGLALLGLGLTLLPARGLMAAGFTYKELARLDTKAPGGGMLVNDFEPGRVSGQGEVAFVVDYDASNSEGLYLASNGALIPIEEPGKPVGPAAPDWTFVANGTIGQILSPVGMNAAGDVSFGSDAQKKGDSDIHTGNFLSRKASSCGPTRMARCTPSPGRETRPLTAAPSPGCAGRI